MAVTVYMSTDASAPALSGTVGSLIGVLDACLVNGYGAKAAAGWTKPFSGTNLATYRGGSGVQHYLEIQDNQATPQEALARGWETCSAQSVGTGEFPTAVQLGDRIRVRKSSTSDATARAWIVVADARTVYLSVLFNTTAWTSFGFGEIFSYLTGDNYRTIIFGRHVLNTSDAANENGDRLALNHASPFVTAGHYMPRGYAGSGGSLQVGKHGDTVKGFAQGTLMGGMVYPNGPDGGLYLSRVYVMEGAGHVRGHLRGFYHQVHAIANFAQNLPGDTFSGVGDFAGKSFRIIRNTLQSGALTFETSNTWETN